MNADFRLKDQNNPILAPSTMNVKKDYTDIYYCEISENQDKKTF